MEFLLDPNIWAGFITCPNYYDMEDRNERRNQNNKIIIT